jgi:RimJ/RimL family protein N-acetyltransferase
MRWPTSSRSHSDGECTRGRHVVSTSRLLLRTATAPELKVAQAAGSDPEAQRWLGWPRQDLVPERERKRLLATRTRSGRSAINWHEADAPKSMMAIDRERRRYTGMFTVTPHTCEIGGYLSPAYRGLGLGTELFMAACRFAHGHLGLTEIRAGTEPDNAACIRSLQSAGFTAATGPSTHRLPDARIVPAAWFSHSAPYALTCSATQDRRARNSSR